LTAWSTFEADVTHLSQQGYGVVRAPDRTTFFVRGAWRGDRGLFQPTQLREGDYHFAELIELRAGSPDRQAVPCPHLGVGEQQCFGCPWMMIDYDAQLREKQHRVQYALARVGLVDAPVATIWPSPQLLQYRRRAQFKVDGQRLGYAGRQGLTIAAIEQCPILTPPLQGMLSKLRARLPEPLWRPDSAHIWNYIDIDEDCDPDRVILNRRRPFQQANAVQNEAMRAWLRTQLEDHARSSPILELFAGSGNFTEVLVDAGFERIITCEVGADAVTAAQEKQWTAVDAQRVDLYGRHAVKHVATAALDARILIANPPRDGLRAHWRLAQCLPALQSIFIVSCDPVTLAHDVRKLSQTGFRLRTVQPLDQMPHTPHVETLVFMERVALASGRER
jgi:23S rRNA (uracil1939-C5)-methyltransferase